MIRRLVRMTSKILVLSLLITSISPLGVYAKSKKTHDVTFMYGTRKCVVTVNDGENVIDDAPTDTFFPGYIFLGWTDNLKNIKADRTVLGAYSKTSGMVASPLKTLVYVNSILTQSYASGRKYNNDLSAGWPTSWFSKDTAVDLLEGEEGETCAVHWYNSLTGQLWKTDLVTYGTSLPSPINDPYVPGYTFVGWEGSWNNITEDRCIAAMFAPAHQVFFIDTLTNNCFYSVEAEDGSSIDLPAAPYHDGFAFSRYQGDTTYISGDTYIYAIYEIAR